MNTPTALPACPEFEHEIADLVDGLLDESAARPVRAHLDACAACRAWHADYVATDAQLQAAMAAPSLSPGFDAALGARIQTLQANGRDVRRAAAQAEHDQMLTTLLRQSRRRGVMGALSTALAAACGVVFVESLAPREATLLTSLQGTDRLLALGGIGALIALGVVAWTLSRNALVTPRLARW